MYVSDDEMEGKEMPVGNPTKQTIATKKYEAKAGWISKSYKLKKELVEEFAQACEDAGVSQAGQLSAMMEAFIKNVEKNKR